jgi:hypothetical protein
MPIVAQMQQRVQIRRSHPWWTPARIKCMVQHTTSQCSEREGVATLSDYRCATISAKLGKQAHVTQKKKTRSSRLLACSFVLTERYRIVCAKGRQGCAGAANAALCRHDSRSCSQVGNDCVNVALAHFALALEVLAGRLWQRFCRVPLFEVGKQRIAEVNWVRCDVPGEGFTSVSTR